MKQSGKRAQRRNRGNGRVRHLDGIWRQPRKSWVQIAKNGNGTVWFVWYLADFDTACSPKIGGAIEEVFRASELRDPETDIPTTEVE